MSLLKLQKIPNRWHSHSKSLQNMPKIYQIKIVHKRFLKIFCLSFDWISYFPKTSARQVLFFVFFDLLKKYIENFEWKNCWYFCWFCFFSNLNTNVEYTLYIWKKMYFCCFLYKCIAGDFVSLKWISCSQVELVSEWNKLSKKCGNFDWVCRNFMQIYVGMFVKKCGRENSMEITLENSWKFLEKFKSTHKEIFILRLKTKEEEIKLIHTLKIILEKIKNVEKVLLLCQSVQGNARFRLHWFKFVLHLSSDWNRVFY